ncbi:uncharacterized protein LOC9324916 [Arabidopsis lyrata subsp. lyrata]|uniref:uncharacterized protein LOC9324916 n=1 Tax=Arabidopsis lyrata subsp. lyrata TaxID=81972 RepID=UPI000A29C3F7|nr:uncharacterized protein LOC9324916 [Arabidopsis lyrata subsp. lyrata]|eukprot:XP_020891588.1 uncharacterized protein LOC9324916 [Arabidopsis lyrata subsp. lyrata]
MLLSMNLLISELTPSRQSFSTDPTSRRALSDLWPTAAKLGFCLEGFEPNFGPLPIQRPKPIPSDPCLNDIKPRSVSLCFLSICSQKLGRSLHLNGRRHHLREESPSLLRFFNYTLRTLDLVLILAKSYEPKSWKVYSLLFPIPNCWRIVCSYRSSVSKCSPMVAFAKDFKHRLNVISNKLIIMCSSPHSDLEDFSSVFENVLNRSFTVALPCLQPLLPDRNSSLAPSLTSRCLLTVTISPSFDLFMEARSTNRDLTCVQMLSSFGFKALMEPSSIYFSYLLVVLGYAPLCNAFLNFGIFAPMLSLYLNFC